MTTKTLRIRIDEEDYHFLARVAGVSVSRMMDLLRDFGIEANLSWRIIEPAWTPPDCCQ